MAYGPHRPAPGRTRFPAFLSRVGVFLLVLALLPGPVLAPAETARPGPAGPSFQSAPEEGTARVHGALLAWSVLGQGPPLLLITGYGATRDLWASDLVARLARTHRVILYDHRGMGGSRVPDGPYGLDTLARDALGLLDALGLPRTDLMGWSMGAAVALEAALARPDRVDRLVLHGACADPAHLNEVVGRLSSMTVPEFLAARFPPGWAEAHPEALAAIPRPAGPGNPAAVALQRQAMAAWPGILDRLSGLDRPVLVVTGQDDWVCPPDQARMLRERIPGAVVRLLPGQGHWAMYQDPEGLAGVVEEWLN